MALELINGEEEMAPPHRRFQRGALDEVSFAGPELGRLAAVLVAPSSGTWELDELIVSSSRCHSSQRFVCRQFLGEGRKAEAPAVQLLPVSSDAVLYGDRQLSAEQASRMYRSNMDDYRARRVTQLVANAALIASGSVLTLAVAGPGYSVPFAVGGVEGMAYFWLLARQVDGIASAASASAYPSAQQPSPSGTLGTLIRATETAPFRYAVLLAMLYGFFWALQNVDSPVGDPNAQTAQVRPPLHRTHPMSRTPPPRQRTPCPVHPRLANALCAHTPMHVLLHPSRAQPRRARPFPIPFPQALLGVLGFLQYKAAVIVTALMPEDMDEKVQELVEDVQDEVQEKLRRGQ